MRSLIKLLEPDRFEDLMALVALYRPGPLNNGLHTEYAERKHGRRKVTYPHDDLEPILQGHVRRDDLPGAGHAGGRGAGRLLDGRGRHAPQGDGQEELAVLMPFKEKFIAGAVEKGYQQRLAADLFEMIVPFADYGFNASHACAYGLVAYQTAYLMAHHPRRVHVGDAHVREGRQGSQALLPLRVPRDGDRGPASRRERVRAGLRARRPATTPSIRYGLSAVRNVGEGAVQQIIDGAPRRRARSPPSPTSAARSSRAC